MGWDVEGESEAQRNRLARQDEERMGFLPLQTREEREESLRRSAEEAKCVVRGWPVGAVECVTCDGMGWLDDPNNEHRGLLCGLCGGDGYVTPGEHRECVPNVVDEQLEATAPVAVSR